MGVPMWLKMLFTILLGYLCTGVMQAMGQKSQSVPNDMLGIWSGTAGAPTGTSWDIIFTVVGGSHDGPFGVFERRYSGNTCLHTIGADPPKKGRNTKQDPDTFKARTLTSNSLTKSACRHGKLSINYSQSNRLLIDATWEDKDGKATPWIFVLNRLDSGRTAKSMEKCRPAGSPLSKLKDAVKKG